MKYGKVSIAINGQDIQAENADISFGDEAWYLDPAHENKLRWSPGRWSPGQATMTFKCTRMGSLRPLRKLIIARRFSARAMRRREPHPARIERMKRRLEWFLVQRFGAPTTIGDGPGQVRQSDIERALEEFFARQKS